MKRLQRFLLLLAVVLLAFGLAACGGDSGGGDEDSGNQNTAQPTEASSQSTSTNEDTNNTIDSDNASSDATSFEDQYGGVLTFTLPDGWVYDAGSNRIANTPDALSAEEFVDLGEGQMIIIPGTIPFNSPRMEELNLNPRSAPVLILGNLTREYDDAYKFGSARPNMMSGTLTGTVEGSYTVGETEMDVSMSMFPKDGAFTTTVAYAPDGFIDGGVTGTIRTLMDSFEYTPGEMPTTTDEEMDATEEAADSVETIDATEEAEMTEEASSTEMDATEEAAEPTEEVEATEES